MASGGGRTPKQRRCEMSSGMVVLRNAHSTPRRRRGSCKCLFGAPDRDETVRLVSEQYSWDRKRFIRRFNFDIDTECVYRSSKLESPVKFLKCDVDKRSPNAAEALASVVNTDIMVLGSPSSRRSSGSAGSSPRTPRTPRTARTPRTPRNPASRRQLQMTDYWTQRKRTESESSDKEN